MRRGDGLVLLFTPAVRPDARAIPATSGATRPGVRENGGQYTHAAIWAVMRLRARWATATGPASSSRSSIPINRTGTRAGVHRYKVEPYVAAADVYARAAASPGAGMDLVHGLGGLDVPRRHRVAARASGCVGAALHLDPASRARGAGFHADLPLPRRDLPLIQVVGEPSRRHPWRVGRIRSSSTAAPITPGPEGIGLASGDGHTSHRIRVVLG